MLDGLIVASVIAIAAGGAMDQKDALLLQGRVSDFVENSDSETTPAMVFSDIESGIASTDVKRFSLHFHRQVYIHVRGKEGSYFSAKQAHFVLQNFLDGKKIVNFRLTKIDNDASPSYATGGGTLMNRGNPEIFQVYAGLSHVDGKWAITQFSIY